MNLFEFVPLRPTQYDTDPPIETAQRWGRFTRIEALQWSAEGVADVLACWSEVTGQDQGWNMFTPGFPAYTVVLFAEFRFADGGTDRASSRFNPMSATNPAARWPVIDDREFNYEANIFMLAWECDPDALARQPEIWGKLPQRVRENEQLISAWMRWKLNRYCAAHRDKARPVEVVLHLRYIPIRLPDESAVLPNRSEFDRPIARWRPGEVPEPGFMPIEGYDPVAARFVRLEIWPRP